MSKDGHSTERPVTGQFLYRQCEAACLSLRILYAHGMHLYTVLIRHFLPCVPCFHTRRKTNGLVLFIVDYGLLRYERAADIRDRKTGEAIMTFYLLGGIVALGLMVYLFIALLKPELFS
ncbi:MAG TPA: K(+)-transporting ATPase subunit F [Gallionella sp.]|nr:K(+)-transporting ATPase subunit F [Gallionella sp.]